MKRNFLLAIIIALITVSTTACEGTTRSTDAYQEETVQEDVQKDVEEDAENAGTEKFGTFIVISSNDIVVGSVYTQYIVYDPDTMVMWTIMKSKYSTNLEMSVLYNADGTPRIYSPNTEID